jgi:hypothetical protein
VSRWSRSIATSIRLLPSINRRMVPMGQESEKYNGSDRMLAVKRPIQFFAFAWGTTIALLAAATWNDPFLTTLGRDGMLIFAATFAAVLLAVLALFTLVLYKRGDAFDSTSHAEPPSKLEANREPAHELVGAAVDSP